MSARSRIRVACGACYAFGTAADLESRLLMAGQGLFDVSENNIKECNYQDASCWRRQPVHDHVLLTRDGAVLESCDPYVASDVACTSGCDATFHGAGLDPDFRQHGARPGCSEAVPHGPRAGAHHGLCRRDNTEPTFSSQFNNYDGTGALYYTGNHTPNHSVFLVGWDDSLVHAGGTGAWIVKNSWGTSWGGTCGYGASGGYFYIAYGSASIGMYSSVIREYMVTDDSFSVLSHDEGGYNTACQLGSSTLVGMSSLTAR